MRDRWREKKEKKVKEGLMEWKRIKTDIKNSSLCRSNELWRVIISNTYQYNLISGT